MSERVSLAEGLEDRARRLVSEVFGVPLATVTLEASQDSIESWDSLNMVNLVMAIEAEFEVSVSIDEAVDLLSVKLILALLREKGLS